MIKLFAANNLVRNLEKTDLLKSITKNSSHSTLRIGFKEKCVERKVNTKLLGLQTDNHINWKAQIEQIIPNYSRIITYQQMH
jgi:hypothetical protein